MIKNGSLYLATIYSNDFEKDLIAYYAFYFYTWVIFDL